LCDRASKVSQIKRNIFIGTSGYNYHHWRKVFYPEEVSPAKWLEFYAQHFNCVELNVTFYRLPSGKTFDNWYKRTPVDFRFVIKGSRFITHIKRLKDCAEPLKVFFDSAGRLKEKLLCVLWQLPPSFKFEIGRLTDFLKILKRDYSNYLHSFEFRNVSWFNEQTYEVLGKDNFNLCIADSPKFPCCERVTSKFIYLRFHGGKVLYGSEYSDEELTLWAEKVRKWFVSQNPLLFSFFNNDAHGFAVKNALRFKELVEGLL